MNATGLNIIKTLGCMTAVTFFTIYNTWDHYDYDYHWILGFLTFISTDNRGTARAGSWVKLKVW